jgi:hypothetical protein
MILEAAQGNDKPAPRSNDQALIVHVIESYMPVTYIIGLVFLLQAAGCAITSSAPAPAAMQGGTVVVEQLSSTPQDQLPRNIDTSGGTLIVERLPPLPELVSPVPGITTPVTPDAPVTPAAPAAVLPATPAPRVAATPATPASAAAKPVIPAPPAAVVVADKPVVKPPVKATAPVVRTPPAQKSGPAPARTAASTLDLDALEQRLKDTDAIGVFTKIALKNQVDDLLKRFKAYHESDGKAALAQLRQSYDQLLLKVNDVLKNGDPSLASEIMGSREAIWSLLSDPVKFAKL